MLLNLTFKKLNLDFDKKQNKHYFKKPFNYFAILFISSSQATFRKNKFIIESNICYKKREF